MAESDRSLAYDIRELWETPHLEKVLKIRSRVNFLEKSGSISVDGESLDVATVVAHGAIVSVEESAKTLTRLDDSVKVLNDYLANGYYLYGVNTGFGGSADTRTKDLLGLQRALMQHVQSAILTPEDKSDAAARHEYLESHSMPTAWVRAAMLIRLNANIRGHSGIHANTLKTIIELLKHDIIPIIPLRGSLSASGDLMPLSYIAGAIQGNPDIFVRVGGNAGPPRVMTAEKALEEASIEPVVLGPKEGLSLINGTAAAAAVATLGLHEAHQLAVASQALTAMGSEALFGNAEWAHPFVAAVRPHRGQIEAAQNIRTFLGGSQLIVGLEKSKDRFKSGLAQERYAWRSAPQWLSPHLEDLVHADSQLTVELNSTSDNPLINVTDNDVHCGANFQAAAVTAATEKIRLSLQSIGKMLFSQVSEMINNDLSNGLPPNLAADDPSLSFCLKGVDANTAAYTSELGFLANPGVDIRTLHRTFLDKIKAPAGELIKASIQVKDNKLLDTFWLLFEETWYKSAALDATERADKASEALATAIVAIPNATSSTSVEQLSKTHRALSALVFDTYIQHREAFFHHPTTPAYLGNGTKVLYHFVREKLQVPLHRGLIEHPVAGAKDGNMIDGRPKKTIGSWVSIIYEAVRSGELYAEILEFLGGECGRGESNGHGKMQKTNGTSNGVGSGKGMNGFSNGVVNGRM
ncbi:Nn.00g017870.m01.CDS01 [Neocucurbitaria sp. VM-36]